MAAHWVRYFGAPLTIIADQGAEFIAGAFSEFCDRNSILFTPIDVRAPWQNGRTERHGGIFKALYEKARYLRAPRNEAEINLLASECVSAKNRMSNRSGYSPLQRVFGVTHRLPGDLCSDDLYLSLIHICRCRRRG